LLLFSSLFLCCCFFYCFSTVVSPSDYNLPTETETETESPKGLRVLRPSITQRLLALRVAAAAAAAAVAIIVWFLLQIRIYPSILFYPIVNDPPKQQKNDQPPNMVSQEQSHG